MIFSLGVFDAAYAGTYTFDTIPSNGVIQGLPGSTIGWGYTISNNSSTDWLVTTGLNAGLFTNGTPDGSYFDFPAIAPGLTTTVNFDPVAFTGLYGLTWDVSAPPGSVDSGQFILSAQWWTGDPSGTGTFIENAPDEGSPYSASVVSAPSSAPEPVSCFTVLIGLAALLLLRRTRRKPDQGL
jgi:hypothetical protein